MRVPQIVADYQGDVARVPNAGAGAYARASAGEMATAIAGDIARQEAILRQREQTAKDSILAIELDAKMGEAVFKKKEALLKRDDFENFDSDLESDIKAMKDEFMPQNASPELQQAFARSFRNYSQDLRYSVQGQKYKVMEGRGRVAILHITDKAAQMYAAETDPLKKEYIKKQHELDVRRELNLNYVDPVWGENQIEGFEKYARGVESDAAKAIIYNEMSERPAQLAKNLDDPNYLPGLTDKSERAHFKNQAKTAANMQQAEAERKTKEIQTELHDKEERAIGNFYMAGDYSKAYALAQSSKVLKGDEKASWANAIKNASKVSADYIDPRIETVEINKVNQMIAQNKPLPETRDFIIQSPNLSRGNKEQYLNKLETDYSSEMKEIRSLMLNTIKDTIVPKRGMTSQILETPLESLAVANSSIQGLDWLDEQIKTGKRISRTEALYKAGTIAAEHQVSISEQIGFLQSEAKRIKEEVAKANKK